LLASLAVLVFDATDASAYDIATGGFHTCALDDNGVTCWGYNGQGQTTVPASLVNEDRK
jgi:alpha-tubulin suppressor-like RCC1 family protein